MTAPAEDRHVEAPSGPLPVTRWAGREPAVVLLHAGVADRRAWTAVAEALAADGRAVVAYDRRGFGEAAGPPAREDFTHVADLLAVLDATTAGPAWLVGSSMGGQVAVDAALIAPDRVAGLVLIAPAVSGAPEPEQLDPVTAGIDAALEKATSEDEVNELLVRLWLDGPGAPEGRVGGPARELALDMNAGILAADAPDEAGAAGLDAWSRLEEIAVPVTVARGELDLAFYEEISGALVARIAGARSQVLPGTAHLPYLDAPDTVCELVRSALRGDGRRA